MSISSKAQKRYSRNGDFSAVNRYLPAVTAAKKNLPAPSDSVAGESCALAPLNVTATRFTGSPVTALTTVPRSEACAHNAPEKVKHSQVASTTYRIPDTIEVPIHRIYNRAITDEQVRRGVQPGFAWTGDSLPFLNHLSVPATYFLDRLPERPADLDEWVLKPLYSFAGLGVGVGPGRAELDAFPLAERANWILQRRCRFTALIETPDLHKLRFA